jgi:hypothetical protein
MIVRSIGLIAALSLVAGIGSAQVQVTTYHNDISRSGQNAQETTLTPYNVNVNQFGKLFTQTVDGYVYAQPLYMPGVGVVVNGQTSTHNVLYVATEHDSVFQIDADSGQVLNQVSLIAAGGRTMNTSVDIGSGCTDQVPEVGISGTPVIDPTTGTLYVVAKSVVNNVAVQYLHALDIGSLAEKFGGPVTITGSVPGTGSNSKNSVLPFNSMYENNRPALLLENGHVIIGFGSHCDADPWHGWLMSYNASTLSQEAIFSSTPNGSHGGIWMSGGGIAADASGNTYFSTGNGTWDGSVDYGDSILKMGPPSGGTFAVLDYFTPWDQSALQASDIDVSAGGLLLLPTLPSGQQLLTMVGKNGTLFELDRNNMGKYCPNLTPACTNSDPQIVTEQPGATTGTWGSPAYWNGNLYWGGSNDHLKAFSFNTTTGQIASGTTSVSAFQFEYPSPTPSVSANGNTNGVVWALDNSAYASTCSAGTNCQALYAYEAANLGVQLYNSNEAPQYRDVPGSAVKFATPMIANGKVYVGSQYAVSAYGELPGAGSYASTITGVGLSSAYNLTGLQNAGSIITGGGIDGHSNAYPANLVGTAIAWNGASYTIGSAGMPDAVTSTTLALPPGNYTTLGLLGTAVNGAQVNQSFVVTYSDGTSTTFTQSLSDWGVFTNFAGESIVLTTQYRVIASGATQLGPFNLYGYSFSLNSAKTAVSLKLPANANVVVLAVDLGSATSGTTSQVATPTFSPTPGTYTAAQSVTLSDATGGASIYYTTNGSTPTTSSTLYTGPVTVGATETLTAIAVESGYTNSAVATGTYAINATTATPTLSLPTGTYTSAQSITLSDATGGASIYYTTNGSTPTTASTLYTSPITVSATTTISAIAVSTGNANSAVATATYTIAQPTAAVPTFSPAPGTYAATQVVTLADATSGATIYYTTNGTTPTASSTPYTGPITVSTTTTIAAIAVASGYANSGAASGSYTISTTVSGAPVSVSLSTADTLYGLAVAGTAATGGGLDGYNQAYAANLVGSSVTWNGATFALPSAGPATAVTSATIALPAGNYTALSLLGSGVNGSQASQIFVVTYSDGSTTTFTQSLSDWFTPQSYSGESVAVSMAYRIAGAGQPSTGPFYLYGYSFPLNPAKTVSSVKLPANKNVVVLAMDLTPLAMVAAPTFSPAPGSYAAAQSVTLSDATSGASIYYTTNGSTPTSSSTPYSGPISVASSKTINAIAIETGYASSAVTAGTYTIAAAASPPTFSPTPGTFTTSQTVTLSDTTAGASIYYTIGSSMPTTSSTLYTGPITVGATETLNAIAVATGLGNSAVATGAYTITVPASAPTFSPAPGPYASVQTVTLADATSGASIYYTLDGSTPTTSSALYSAPITVSASETINAIAIAPGGSASAVSSGVYTITPPAGAPTFSPAPGAYTSTQSVTLSDTTSGASIYYTTNGSVPTTSSTLYTGPIAISATTTINAIAFAPGDSASSVSGATYSITLPGGLTPVSAPLGATAGLYGIGTSGTAVTGGGLDGHGYAFASSLLGASLTWNGSTFTFAAPGPGSAAAGVTIPLPAGNYMTLNLLGTAVNGNQAGQTFVVTYSDGTTSTFTQSLSDWGTPQRYAGETRVLTMASRLTSTGATQTGTFNLYGYTFALNSAKTVASITLPGNANVIVLAIDLTPPATPASVSLANGGNLTGLATSGTAITGGGIDGFGHAYAANLVGSTVAWDNLTFNLAASGAGSAITSTRISLPAGKYVSLSLLGTAVNGSQSGQIFTVTYADGTTSTFAQSLSDWFTPQGNLGEATVLSTAYRIASTGATQTGPCYVYGYTFQLNSAKTVSSLTLPGNAKVVVLAIDLLP